MEVVKIEHIQIKVKGVTLKLTVEEAKLLKQQLSLLFPEPPCYYYPTYYPQFQTVPEITWETVTTAYAGGEKC